jgi:hypothetical protein
VLIVVRVKIFLNYDIKEILYDILGHTQDVFHFLVADDVVKPKSSFSLPSIEPL